jgi:hypothetical protein
MRVAFLPEVSHPSLIFEAIWNRGLAERHDETKSGGYDGKMEV